MACRATIIIDPERHRSARVVQRRPARALGLRDAAPRAGAADRRALPRRVEARREDARQARVAAIVRRARALTFLGARERLFSRAVSDARGVAVAAGRRAGGAATRRAPPDAAAVDAVRRPGALRRRRAGRRRSRPTPGCPAACRSDKHARRRRRRTLARPRPTIAEGYTAAYLTTEVWATSTRSGCSRCTSRSPAGTHGAPDCRRRAGLASGSSASARAAAFTARSGRWSTSTSPTGRRPTRSPRRARSSTAATRCTVGPGRTVSLVPDDVVAARRSRRRATPRTGPAGSTARGSFLDFGKATFTWDERRRGRRGAALHLPDARRRRARWSRSDIPTVAGTGPAVTRAARRRRSIGGQPRYVAYWRLYTVDAAARARACSRRPGQLRTTSSPRIAPIARRHRLRRPTVPSSPTRTRTLRRTGGARSRRCFDDRDPARPGPTTPRLQLARLAGRTSRTTSTRARSSGPTSP